MPDSDYEFDPNEVEPGSQRLRLPDRASKLGGAVPVRFTAEMIAEIRELADRDNVSVSSWIRSTVANALELDRVVTVFAMADVIPIRPNIDDYERRTLRAYV